MNSATPPLGPARPEAGPADPESGVRRRERAWVYAAVLGVAVAVGIGAAVLVAPQAPEPAPTAGETALAQAHDDAEHLAGAAALLASAPSSTPSPLSPAASDAVRKAAARTAEVLHVQAAVLAARGSAPATTAVSGTGQASASQTPQETASPPTAADLAAQLRAGAEARSRDLEHVDGPTASILASLAAGQTVQADQLLGAAGSPDASAAASAAASVPAPTASTGAAPCASPSASDASASPPGNSAQSAGAAVRSAEHAAVWTYTVLAARAEAGARAPLLAAAEQHRAELVSLSRAERLACAPLPAAEAGFALPADAGSPAQLAALEGSAVAAWANLVGATEPGLRGAVGEGLVRAARRLASLGAQPSIAASAFPGQPRAQASAPAPGTAP